MIRRTRARRKGSSLIEFTLVGIPLMFALISIFELTRGMWVYQTMAYAVREATRYSAFHGAGCASPHTCQVTVGQLTNLLRSAGPGLDPSTITLTFTSASGSTISGTMSSLSANSTIWPPSGANAPGTSVKIAARYPFHSIMAMFWPGSGGVFRFSPNFNLGASSSERIQF